MIHGTDCGSTPVEAANSVHAAFEQQLKNWALKKQQGACNFRDMQRLYHDECRRAYGWDGSEPYFLYPPADDPALLNGQPLLNAGRATAIAFWEHQESGNCVHYTKQFTAELEITAMPLNTSVELDIPRAKTGMALMRSYGDKLRTALLDAGLLYKARGDDGQERIFAKQRQVRKTFVDIAYIITCKNEVDMAGFRRASRRKFCTCIWHARYCGCEHMKFLSWTATPLNPDPAPTPQHIPLKRTRGRKPDSRIVKRPRME